MECIDKKCPIHNGVKTRGARLEGIVVSDKAKHTAIIEIDYARFNYKYERYSRNRSRIPAHNPACINAKTGDIVGISETRRLSKTKAFAITDVVKKAA